MVTINNVVIHKLIKEQHQPADIILRTALLDLTEPVQKLINSVHEMYSKNSAKAYGKFENEENAYPIIGSLRNLFQHSSENFFNTSRTLMETLKSIVTSVQMATGAYVLMAHITSETSVDYFIVAMISNADGTAINPDTFEVISSAHVDVKDMRIAGRVNLTEWLSDTQNKRYINFLKPKGEVTEYFGKFLACNEIIEGLAETQKLVRAVKAFAKDKHPCSEDDRNAFYSTVTNYCLEIIDSKQALSLDELANAAWPSNPDELKTYFANFDGGITGEFPAQKKGFDSLRKFSGKTPYWNVSLDVAAINNDYAQFNENEKTLLLKKLPQKLYDDLKERFGSHETLETTEES